MKKLKKPLNGFQQKILKLMLESGHFVHEFIANNDLIDSDEIKYKYTLVECKVDDEGLATVRVIYNLANDAVFELIALDLISITESSPVHNIENENFYALTSYGITVGCKLEL